MEHADIYDALRGRILEILDVDPDLVTPDARLSDTLEADSVDLIEIGGYLERTFDVELPEREIYDLETVQDFVELVARKR
ncbi:MAG: acyl carrier protein [Acidimicrobiales bacterium]|nr:acyl carrier protein [Acidimicrobiales bacterium]MCB1250263.1 acyl carrier protein [Acidimicrobiales bacterium]MCB1260610.1 acyl carrier protein [Acidimicrobiales bacterium]